MARTGREVWAKRVERWKDSGLTAKEFAAETGVNVNSLTHWQWKLTQEGQPRKQIAGAPATTHFIEVAAAAPSSTGTDPIEVVLPSGVRLLVPTHFDESALRRLVVVLEGR